MDGRTNDNYEAIVLLNDSCPRALWRWRAEEKREFFCFYFVFFKKNNYLFIYLSSSRATTRVTHYMIVSSKTHRSAQPRC
jgi:hypothetical protein